MRRDYNNTVAHHYQSYRPPLHRLILRKALHQHQQFEKALDVGCGTGKSSIALVPFCEAIIGIDPSEAMLERAIAHEKIQYAHYDKARIDFPNASFDLITFGGALYYAKSRLLLEEILRVAKADSTLLIYDFEVILNKAYEHLDLFKPRSEIDYNHQEDFADLITPQDRIKLEVQEEELIGFPIAASELSHLLLSSMDIDALSARSSEPEAFRKKMAQQLESLTFSPLQAIIYYTKYALNR
ncbi:MAG: class I SAM-dependent methyltransferase [Bacteroidota bacterium]